MSRAIINPPLRDRSATRIHPMQPPKYQGDPAPRPLPVQPMEDGISDQARFRAFIASHAAAYFLGVVSCGCVIGAALRLFD